MEKDKLDLINKIVVLIDTEDSLEKLKKAMRDIRNRHIEFWLNFLR